VKLSENQSLEQILESAIIASWEDLTNGVQPGLIHIEYNFAAGGTLENLSIWSSVTRGHWLLVCEYCTSGSSPQSSSVRFDNGYQSEGLAHTLEFVMQRQNSFAPSPNLGRPGLLQIPRPTAAEIATAAASVSQAFDHLNSALAKPVLA
jgi:hypothetical protein